MKIGVSFKLILKQQLPKGAPVQPTAEPLLKMDLALIDVGPKALVEHGVSFMAHGTTANTKLNLYLILLHTGKQSMRAYGNKSKLIQPFQVTTLMQ